MKFGNPAYEGSSNWDTAGTKNFSSGVDNVVLFVATDSDRTIGDQATNGIPSIFGKALGYTGNDLSTKTPIGRRYGVGNQWSGVTAINENPSGGETTTLYADNIAYANLQSAEKYGFSIEAYDYPEAWEACDGVTSADGHVKFGQQKRKGFGLVYRTLMGDDINALGSDEELHFVWGCKAAVSGKNHATVNESPEAGTMSWECSASTESAVVNVNSVSTTINTAHAVIRKSDFVTAGVVGDAWKFINLVIHGATAAEVKNFTGTTTTLNAQDEWEASMPSVQGLYDLLNATGIKAAVKAAVEA